MTPVFNGTIQESYADIEGPDSALVIMATPIEIIKLKPVSPSSFSGTVDAATALKSIAGKAGLTLENNGVSVKLASPYFPGTAWSQIQNCVQAADCFAPLDDTTKTLSIAPKTGSRGGAATVIIAATGMIGYPKFERNLIRLRTVFAASTFKILQKIKVESQLTAATGEWVIDKIDYNLASETPGGPWETAIRAHPLGEA